MFVPKHEFDAAYALKKSNSANVTQLGMVSQHLR